MGERERERERERDLRDFFANKMNPLLVVLTVCCCVCRERILHFNKYIYEGF